MKLIIDIPDVIYHMVCNTGTFGCYRFNTAKEIKNGIPLDNNYPVIVNEDGKSAYLTQGHIDALLEYEDKQRQERVMRDVIDVIRKANNNDSI